MKTKYIFLTICATTALLSCNKTERATQDDGYVKITVSSESATKTALDGSSVVWSTGDQMRVFYTNDSNGKLFRLNDGAGTGTGTFYGEEPPSGKDNYFAVYPATASYNGTNKFTYQMPAEVEYVEGSFAPGANPMLSSTKSSFDGSFSMKNLCGVMRLQLKGEIEVERLELTFGRKVSGEGIVYRGETSLTMTGGTDADKKVAMTFTNPVQLEASSYKDFYFVLPPDSYSGVTIKAYLPTGENTVLNSTSTFSITRSQVATVQGIMPTPSHPELTVWSFNIACQKNDDNSSWSSSNYWSRRKNGIYAFFNTQTPDIIGTQECEYRQRTDILNNTSGYAAYGLGVDYGRESSGNSGGISWLPSYEDYNTDSSNAIFYKTAKFNVLDQGTFWLSDTPLSVGSDDGHNCAWIKFEWKENGYKFFFFNTHFTGHYTDAAYAARKAEAKILYEQIEAINSEELPVIIVGDFNATKSEMCSENRGYPSWSEYNYARNVDEKTDKTRYPTSYNNFEVTCTGFSDIYSSGTCTGTSSSNIDSIIFGYFYNGKNGLKKGSFGTDFRSYGGVTYISDHWPITATLIFDYQ